MARDMNCVQLIGRLTRDIEVRQTNGGTTVGKISIAVGDKIKRGDSWEDTVSFFDVTLWGKTADSLAQYLVKGKQIAVTGKLKQETWEKDGQRHSKVSVNADSIQLLGGNDKSGSSTTNAVRNTFQNPPKYSNGFESNGFDEDIPF